MEDGKGARDVRAPKSSRMTLKNHTAEARDVTHPGPFHS